MIVKAEDLQADSAYLY